MVLPRRTAIAVFLAFAFAYFLSALIRAITATLSPVLTQEFSLQASDLGLLAGGYFLGFSATQLPLGGWLDRYGPKRVQVCFLAVAVVGCLAFSFVTSFSGLLAARVLCGVGVSACLMAPLTAFRRWYLPASQTRSNAWMLMTGSRGMVPSTLPVKWALPLVGWRPLFLALGVLLIVSIALVAWRVPDWERPIAPPGAAPRTSGFAQVWRNPYFQRLAPLGFFCYGGLLAVQTLWAGPWMEKIAGFSPLEAATGLFWINITMLCTFWTWGMVGPWLAHRGLQTDRLIAWGLPPSFLVLGVLIGAADTLGSATGAWLALYCMSCSFVTLAQPAVGMLFPSEIAGRALTAFNLVIFLGVFVIQWGIGLAIDGLMALWWPQALAYRVAFAAFLMCCVVSFVYFKRGAGDNRAA